MIAQDVRTVDKRESKILCKPGLGDEVFGAKKELRLDEIGFMAYVLSAYQNGDVFDYKNYFQGYRADDIFDILGSCGSTVVETNQGKAFDIRKAREAGFSDSEIFNYLKESFLTKKPFEVKLIFTYKPFIKKLITGNLIILGLFEILRRIFYYVLLGTMRPLRKIDNGG